MVERRTYNTDRFSKEIKDEIVKHWKKDPNTEILVKGITHKEFVQWVKENYPEAKEVDGWYLVAHTPSITR